MSTEHEFKVWLVMKTLDMLMSQHQISFNQAYEGVENLDHFRKHKPLATIPFPEGFNPKSLIGHTPVCEMKGE